MTNIILKKNVIAIIIGASILSSPVIAQSSTNDVINRGIESKQHSEANITAILNRMDNDGNGKVTLDDFISRSLESADAIFTRLDANRDDSILKAEFTTAPAVKHISQISSNASKQCVKKITGLTLAERQSPESLFVLADKDNNGYLSSSEFVAHNMTLAFDRFTELESNGNGTLDKEEIGAEIKARQLIASAQQGCVKKQLALNK